jgi:hypothetical protein
VIRRILLTLAAAALTFVGAAPAALADTTYTACNGVWVIVDYGSLGGVSTQCATSYSTGTAALRSAGFSPTLDSGFLEKISGKPATPDRQTAYWSYWQATRQADGTYSSWRYASTGANSSHPVKGNAEGWHYVSVAGGASAPGAKPPKNPAVTAPPPTSAPSATKSSTAPTTKASTKPTSTSPASSTTTKPSPTSADSQTSSASPSPSGAATSPSASSPTDAPSADPPGMDVPAGSPIAVIATTSALAVGAAGAGGWWLWKGRRR